MRNDDWLEILDNGATARPGAQTERAFRAWQVEKIRQRRGLLLITPIGLGCTVILMNFTMNRTEYSVHCAASPELSVTHSVPLTKHSVQITDLSVPLHRTVYDDLKKSVLRPIGLVDDLKRINEDPLKAISYWVGRQTPELPVPERDRFIVVTAPLVASELPGAAALALEQAKAEAQIVDMRLQKRVTVGGKALAFGDFCRQLSEKTGITLEAVRGVADDKLTVFCTERSLRDVMRQVSEIFGFVWERVGEEGAYRYRLTQPLRARLAEEELRNKDAHDALVALDEELHRLGKYENDTPEQLLERAAQTDDPEKKRQLQNLAMRSSGPMRLYNQLSPEDMKSLQAGKKLDFSSNPQKPGQQALPAEIGKSILGAFAERGRVTVGSDGKVELSVNDNMATAGPRSGEGQSPASLPGTEALSWLQLKRDELGQVSLYGGSGFGFGKGANANYMLCNAQVAEGRSPSHKPDNAKENALLAKEPALAKAVKPGTLPKVSSELTTAELLEVFHRLTGMDVMGDSYTGLYPADMLAKAPHTSLHDLLSAACDRVSLRWRYERPTASETRPLLRFRTTEFFNRRPQEIPNRAIVRWEEARKAEGALSSELLCEIARLTDEQLDSQANARSLQERSKLLEWRWVANLKNHWRFLAVLSSAQRTQAQETGVPLTALSFGLQEQFLHNVFAHSTSSSAEWPALEWQRDAQFAVQYTPMKPTEESPKLVFLYRGLRRSESGPRLVYTEDERFNSYGPRPEK